MTQFSAERRLTGSPLNLSVHQPPGTARPTREMFLADVLAGLSAPHKTIPAKYFYDERGSELFDEICELQEYYPTRTEVWLLRRYGREIAAWVGGGAHIVEFGSGSTQKIRLLLNALDAPTAYTAVDISGDYLVRATRDLAEDFPAITVTALCADFTQPFRIPRATGRPVGFFPGSTIGNLSHAEAEAFLRSAATVLGPGAGLLIGVDLKKDSRILHAAYNDAAGVTAAFNLNLLARINRELGGTFSLPGFVHEAKYVEGAGRVEMHLRSRTAQTVTIAGHIFSFRPGETIHTENSHKYSADEFRALSGRAGWTTEQVWVDPDGLFSLQFLAAPPRP